MMLKGNRRPVGLIAQAHEGLRSAETQRRQQLQLSASLIGERSPSAGASLARPPQLPVATRGSSEGYPQELRGSPSSAGSLLPCLPLSAPAAGGLPELRDVAAGIASPARTPPDAQRRRSSRGAAGSGSGSGNTPRRAGSSGSWASSGSGGGRRRGGGEAGAAVAPASPRLALGDIEQFAAQEAEEARAFREETEEADYLSQLEDLADLCRHLGLGGEDDVGGFSSRGLGEWRPATGGTSASASTTAPPTSAAGEWSALPEQDELHGEGGGPSAEEPLSIHQRVHAELQNAKLPHGCRVENLMCSSAQFFFVMDVTEGPYVPATLSFWVKLFDDFPAEGSFSVRSSKRLFHPAVDPSTNRVDVPHERLAAQGPPSVRSLLLAVRELVAAPSDSPATNGEAAMLLQTDPDEFRRTARLTLNGGEYNGVVFDRIIAPSKPGTKLGKSGGGGSFERLMSDQMKLDLMNLEVVKEDFKKQASEWQRVNLQEIRDLQS